MECHRCEHQEAIAAGKFRGIAFEETPCAKCTLRDGLTYVVPFNEECGAGIADAAGAQSVEPRPNEMIREEGCAGDVPFPEEYEEDELLLPLSVMNEIVSRLLEMAPATRDVVCWRFMGMPYADIARTLGATVATVELRHKRALADWPALRVLFSAKVMKRRRRKMYRRHSNRWITRQ